MGNSSVNASIIIVSYNNWETTTKDCLESLLADETNKSLEIIVVDNNSNDKTPQILRTIASENANIQIILNKENRGFAGGNNDGVKRANGDVVILLNSDTIVPPNSMVRLTDILNANRDWAMLGPVTNEAGNEQKIMKGSSCQEKSIQKGLKWCLHSNGDCFESRRLDFCCVAIRKDAYEALGGLDESFGLGYYEDTDFSLRALEKGFRMFFTEEIFVYHKAGKSFLSHGKKNISKLMKENKKRLKKKVSQSFELHHIRDCNLSILKKYLHMLEGNPSDFEYCEKLIYRLDQRLLLGQSLYPNNPLKKVRYWLALNRVSKKRISFMKLACRAKKYGSNNTLR